MTEEKKISMLHTPCKNCIAAVYENKTQTKCFFDQLKNFDSVLEVYDDEKEFFVINNKKCIYYREQKWLEKKELDLKNSMDEIIKENTIPYIAIINIDGINNEAKLKLAIEKLQNQKTKPCGVMVMMQKKKKYDISTEKIIDIVQSSGFVWKIKSFIEEYDLYRYIKAIIQSAPRKRLYLLMNNTDIPENFYEQIIKYNLNNNPIAAINIKDNIFFAFAAVAYTMQLFQKNILLESGMQKLYEDIQ